MPSLYHHVDGLPALRARVRRFALSGSARACDAPPTGRAGRAAVAGLVRGLHAFGATHPGLLAATVAPPDDPEGRAAGEAVVAVAFDVLGGYGLEGEALVHATRVLRAAVHGFAALDAAGELARRSGRAQLGGPRHRPGWRRPRPRGRGGGARGLRPVPTHRTRVPGASFGAWT